MKLPRVWILLGLLTSALGGLSVATNAQSPAPALATVVTLRPTVVQVTCDHPEWNYLPGQPVKFRIAVTTDGKSVANAAISYTIGPEMIPAEKREAVTSADGTVTLDGGTLREPGFLRCIATVETEGRPVRGLATAAFSPEKIKPTQIEPVDFDAFWAKAKEELAKLPIDARLTPMPEQSTEKVEVFQVSLQNIGTSPSRTSRFYGVLCVPRGEGPFPAMMIPPGAGIRKLRGQIQWAERGFITLEVGVHGIPVILPEELYVSLGGALGSYQTIALDDRERYYFRRVFMGCLRANDYLASHPKWDRKNLIDFGGSQGGFLSIVTTALDPRVTALVAAFPAYCDVTGYVYGRAGGWPGLRFADKNEPGRDAKIATTAYYDAVNFARRLKVPGHFGWGYNDETCPPTSTFSAYNVITSPKTLSIFKEMGHPRVPGLTVAEREWLLKQVGIPLP
ncbi:MAG: acetylxylan esterase [Opitutaceae bacterium]